MASPSPEQTRVCHCHWMRPEARGRCAAVVAEGREPQSRVESQVADRPRLLLSLMRAAHSHSHGRSGHCCTHCCSSVLPCLTAASPSILPGPSRLLAVSLMQERRAQAASARLSSLGCSSPCLCPCCSGSVPRIAPAVAADAARTARAVNSHDGHAAPAASLAAACCRMQSCQTAM